MKLRSICIVLATIIASCARGPSHTTPSEPQTVIQRVTLIDGTGGIAPSDILVMATRNAAELLDATDEIGTLEVGKRADMLLVSADPRESVRNLREITRVFRDGRVVWSEQ